MIKVGLAILFLTSLPLSASDLTEKTFAVRHHDKNNRIVGHCHLARGGIFYDIVVTHFVSLDLAKTHTYKTSLRPDFMPSKAPDLDCAEQSAIIAELQSRIETRKARLFN